MIKKVDVMAPRNDFGKSIPSEFVLFESVAFPSTGFGPMERPRKICSMANEKNKIPEANTAMNTLISEKIRRTIVTYLHTTRITRSSAT